NPSLTLRASDPQLGCGPLRLRARRSDLSISSISLHYTFRSKLTPWPLKNFLGRLNPVSAGFGWLGKPDRMSNISDAEPQVSYSFPALARCKAMPGQYV
ncbi:fd8f1aed-a4b2-43f6-842d-2e19b8166f81, partial [Thermothielavioides terrestris]